jgi:hypothetical protein
LLFYDSLKEKPEVIMNRHFLVIASLGVCLSSLPVSSAEFSGIASQYKANLDQDVCRAMTRAADFLVAVQKPAKLGAVGWSWQIGKGPVSGNVAGLAALSLLSAHSTSGKKSYLAAARRYADGLVAGKGGWSTDNLPYKADIEFLVSMSKATGESRYRDTALAAFDLIRRRSPDGAHEVSRIASGRVKTPTLLGFDAALGIMAATAVSNRRYAYQMADAVLSRLAEWYRPKENPRFSLVSGAALAEALDDLDSGHYRDNIERFREDLLKAQQPNGAWLSNETQPVAYAVMALAGGNPTQRTAYQKGIDWLKSTMLKKGSYAVYNDFMPEPFVGQVISEVHAEALSALAMACKND